MENEHAKGLRRTKGKRGELLDTIRGIYEDEGAPMTIEHIAATLGWTKFAVSRLMVSLKANGLVRRAGVLMPTGVSLNPQTLWVPVDEGGGNDDE